MNMTSHALGVNPFSYSGLPNWSRISLDLRFFVFLMRVPRNCQVEQTGWLALVIHNTSLGNYANGEKN